MWQLQVQKEHIHIHTLTLTLWPQNLTPSSVPQSLLVVKVWSNSVNKCTQYVRCPGSRSTPLLVLCGVPQWSVLGLILFLLYTADLVQLVGSSELYPHLYANNTQIYGFCWPGDTDSLWERAIDCPCPRVNRSRRSGCCQCTHVDIVHAPVKINGSNGRTGRTGSTTHELINRPPQLRWTRFLTAHFLSPERFTLLALQVVQLSGLRVQLAVNKRAFANNHLLCLWRVDLHEIIWRPLFKFIGQLHFWT